MPRPVVVVVAVLIPPTPCLSSMCTCLCVDFAPKRPEVSTEAVLRSTQLARRLRDFEEVLNCCLQYSSDAVVAPEYAVTVHNDPNCVVFLPVLFPRAVPSRTNVQMLCLRVRP